MRGLLASLTGLGLREDVAVGVLEQVAPPPYVPHGPLKGLPAYWPVGRGGAANDLAWRRNLGLDMRATQMVVLCDLHGQAPVEIAGDFGLNDHRGFTKGDEFNNGDSRGARRYLPRGRRLLQALGAWPWAHAPEGALPAEWWSSDGYLEPLRAWHEDAYVAARKQLDDSADPGGPLWSNTGLEARRFYRGLLG